MNEKQYDNWRKSGYCDMYEACPICFRCMVKASHLYAKCAECPVEFDPHDNRKRNFLIRRENFAINVSDEVGEEFKKLSEGGHEDGRTV